MPEAVHHHPEVWIEGFLSARAVDKGGVIRRSVAWVEHEIGRELFIAEIRRRGFCLLEAGGQFIVICSRGPIRRIL